MSDRLTYSGQLAAQHELLMAAVTKTPPRGKRWEVTVDQQKIGDLKGQWLGGLTVSPEDEEDWPQFLGRWAQMLDDLDRELIRRNSTLIQRQLEQTLETISDDPEPTKPRRVK